MAYPDGVDGGRERALAQIRATYASYDDAGRDRLWDPSNRGYARLARQVRDRLLGEMARSLPENAGRILDLGCGTGGLYADAQAAGIQAQWSGVDLRPEAVAVARKRYPQGSFDSASADRVPAPDASYDIVVSQVLFSSIPSDAMQKAVVAEVARLLRPAGWLIWSDIRYSNPANPHVRGLSLRDIRRLFVGWRLELRAVGLLPPLARRLGPFSAAYPALAAIPPLRSHLVGRLQPPGQE